MWTTGMTSTPLLGDAALLVVGITSTNTCGPDPSIRKHQRMAIRFYLMKNSVLVALFQQNNICK